MDAKTKRRWYQFGLRTLFVLVTIACTGFGWIAYKWRQAQIQREGVQSIQSVGGNIEYDYPWDEDGTYNSDKVTPPAGYLRNKFGDDLFLNVKVVSFWNTGVHLDDAALTHLDTFTQLEAISLAGTGIRDNSLARIRGLTQLVYVGLDRNPITDVGIENLCGLTRLRGLELSDTKVSDAGLRHLHGLRKLRKVWLYGTPVTDAGAQELKKALPKLEIVR